MTTGATVLMEARLGGRVPRYLQIADALRRRLAGRATGRAAPLPSEFVLATEFRVSRETLRQALALLRDEGLIYSLVGRGTFASLVTATLVSASPSRSMSPTSAGAPAS